MLVFPFPCPRGPRAASRGRVTWRDPQYKLWENGGEGAQRDLFLGGLSDGAQSFGPWPRSYLLGARPSTVRFSRPEVQGCGAKSELFNRQEGDVAGSPSARSAASNNSSFERLTISSP